MHLSFPSPQFKLLPDPQGHRLYANVDNMMEVHTDAGMYHVTLAVSADLFTMMKDVFKVPREDTVHLSIEEMGDRYVFSMMYGETLVDLWDYSRGSLPEWVLNRG